MKLQRTVNVFRVGFGHAGFLYFEPLGSYSLKRQCVSILALLQLFCPMFGGVDVVYKQTSILLACVARFRKRQGWIGAKPDIGSFFGMRTGVVEYPEFRAVGLDSEKQSVPVSQTCPRKSVSKS